jgi:hypothetical protein
LDYETHPCRINRTPSPEPDGPGMAPVAATHRRIAPDLLSPPHARLGDRQHAPAKRGSQVSADPGSEPANGGSASCAADVEQALGAANQQSPAVRPDAWSGLAASASTRV